MPMLVIDNALASTGAQAARATSAGCVARRLRPTHTGKHTLTIGILSPNVMAGPMMHAWTQLKWRAEDMVIREKPGLLF